MNVSNADNIFLEDSWRDGSDNDSNRGRFSINLSSPRGLKFETRKATRIRFPHPYVCELSAYHQISEKKLQSYSLCATLTFISKLEC